MTEASIAFVAGLLADPSRAVVVTPAGRMQLEKVFNVRWEERTS